MAESVVNEIYTNLNIFVLQTVTRMRDAEEKKDYDRAMVDFEYALQTLQEYLKSDIRIKVQEDYLHYKTFLRKLEADQGNELFRTKQINELKRDFIENHRIYIFMNFSKCGITIINEEGVIDLENRELDEVSYIVRSRTINEEIEKTEEVKEENHGKL